MDTKKITYSAIFSSILILFSIISITTVVGETLFLDIIVPIYICVVYFKIDRKYTVFMAITSFTIVFLVLGNVVSAIWMAQGMIVGFICTIFISRDSSILDDFLFSSILSSFVIILIDIYLSSITGFSIIKDSEDLLKILITTLNNYNINIVIPDYFSSLVLYISVASIPLGTVIVVYIGSLILGKKLNVLDKNTKRKFLIFKEFKRYGAFLCCSKEAYNFSIMYVIIIEIIKFLNINIGITYIRVLIMSIEVICFYFLAKDSFSFFMKYIILNEKYNKFYKISMILTLYFLCVSFKLTITILLILSFAINRKIKLRDRQILKLRSI